ncbi:MAG: ATP-binding cassette domain-containing protein [Gammaproteobacteria bacterium]|nr:ATP-binding cassette domain-containing protein [Gammaproteobacteria bacterium]
MSEPVIEVRNLIKTYQLGDVEVRALRGVDLTIERGEFVAIMGASGSGKSTLMNTLGCLDKPTSGQYLLEGIDTATLDEPALARIRNLRIGFVFQSFNLLARTSAAENVALPLFYTEHTTDTNQRVQDALTALGLQGREQNHPSQLSGGQQQRVAIARALINSPAILLADEPTGNLDSKTANDIMLTLQKFNREQGLTVILVTHEPDMAAFADRVVTMRDGMIISDERRAPHEMESEASALKNTANVTADTKSAMALDDTWSFARMALSAAWRALARNKMRSALTMLGIFIGVAALITMVAVGQGANAAVKQQIESLGTNLLIVLPGATTSSGVRAGFGSASTLTVADAEALKKEDPAIANVAYQIRQVGQVQYGNQNWGTELQGVSPSFLSIRNWSIVSGRALTNEDERNANRVCLLGQTVVKNLFGPYENPVGATIFIKNVPVEVIGVLEGKGQTGYGRDQDDTILMPFSTAERKVLGVSTPTQTDSTTNSIYTQAPNPFGIKPKLAGYVNIIFVQATSTAAVPVALAQVTKTLRERHHIQPGQTDDFGVRNISDITQAAESSSRIMALLLASVASISLLVGGIGIMNILLVSVTERTREIGIRMAIGARRIHVLMQFLIESVLLSLIGGSVGVVTGIVVSKLISAIAGWPTLLSPLAMLSGFVFSAAVGVFFGFYPARRASHMNPIEALRFE